MEPDGRTFEERHPHSLAAAVIRQMRRHPGEWPLTDELVQMWQLERAGFRRREARELLGTLDEAGVGQVLALVERGCAPYTAARIVT